MLTVVLGLGGALLFGASDFIGGIASRVTSPLKVTAISALTGLVLLSTGLMLTGGVWSAEAVAYGALSGVAVGIALALLYTSLAIGPMSILSPLTGLVSALVPMSAGLLRGEQLGLLGYLALGIALVAVVLIGFSPEKATQRPSAKGLITATGAGFMFGVFLILIHATPTDSGLIPLVFSRAANATIMGAAILGMIALSRLRPVTAQDPDAVVPRGMRNLADRPGAPSWRVGIKLAIACGIIDSIANTLQLLGLRVGELSVMSVLNAMYPAGTILLAALVTRERITPLQGVGLGLALLAAVLFALT
jgi:drug/metabolite transporter (DMT)-like permease